MSKLKSGKEQDIAAINELEKKLGHEVEVRTRVEAKLRDHQHATRNSWSGEEVKELKDKLAASEKELEKAKSDLAKCQKDQGDIQEQLEANKALLRSLEADKQQLKVALADETRVKIEVFTALSETRKKHLEELNRKNHEIQRLQRNLAEIIAIMPVPAPQPHPTTTAATQQTSGGQRFSPNSPTGGGGGSSGSGGPGFPQPRPPPSSTP